MEQIITFLFFSCTACYLWYEVSYFYEDVIRPTSQWICRRFLAFQSLLRDFHSRRFYNPFAASERIIEVLGKRNIAEFADSSSMSQRAAYNDKFGLKHTLNEFNHHEQRIFKTRLFGRVLYVNAPKNLETMFEHVRRGMLQNFAKQLLFPSQEQDSVTLSCAKLAREVTACIMSELFFGEKLVSDKKFSDALMQYPKDMVNSMITFQLTPSFIAPLAHRLVTKDGKAMKTLLEKIQGTIETYWQSEHAVDCYTKHTILANMAYMAEKSTHWNSTLLAQSTLGIWFAASHQPFMTVHFIVLELCIRKEWQSILREEVANVKPAYGELENLPLLDSFIKETMRLKPLDTLSTRRKVIKPFKFTEGGPEMSVGAVACVSSSKSMRDPQHYANADSFVGNRFVKVNSEAERKFTEVSEKYPIWGYGSLACPGRLYASLVIKMILVHLITNFDLSLQDETQPTRWMWETFTMPYESTQIKLTKRGSLGSQIFGK